MGKGAKVIKEEIKEVAVEKDKNFIGVPIEENRESGAYKDVIKIPLGYIRAAKVGGEDVEVVLRVNTPPDIESEKYYPVCEWRISGDDLDNADHWPQWKRLPLLIDGQSAMLYGRPVLVSYYVVLAMAAVEEEDQQPQRRGPYVDFKINPPFGDEKIAMSDFGLPVIKGSDIIAINEAKAVLGNNPVFGATRRRGQDTSARAV